jgi:hypothetical protein
MKTAVIGLFDDVDDARRVLTQLAGSPLDLSAIQVVSADTETERTLAEEAGLPGKHHVLTGVIAGAILGAAIGVLAAQLEVMARLGTLLSGAAGILIGGIVGGLVGAAAGRLRLPEGQDELVMSAIDEGATAIVVRTENVPTARAISDLFKSEGSRVSVDGATDYASNVAADSAAFQHPETDTATPDTDTPASPDPTAPPDAIPSVAPPGPPDDDHSRFAPPWSRKQEE